MEEIIQDIAEKITDAKDQKQSAIVQALLTRRRCCVCKVKVVCACRLWSFRHTSSTRLVSKVPVVSFMGVLQLRFGISAISLTMSSVSGCRMLAAGCQSARGTRTLFSVFVSAPVSSSVFVRLCVFALCLRLRLSASMSAFPTVLLFLSVELQAE
eukprot:m.228277 g.228277  ORF g.228277 m.228277 type:complete len:155 (+) comp54246_c1_seq46:889-1353(+)